MLEGLIKKLCKYIERSTGMSTDDICKECKLSLYEIDRLKDILEDDYI